jgi:hypothetical protein
MKTEIKIYAGLALLAALGGGVYLSKKNDKAEREQRSVSTTKTDLPSIALAKDDVDKITKVEVKTDKGSVTLEKKGDDWNLTAPIAAKATSSDVKALVDNLKDLKVTEAIDRTKDHYADYELDDAKAVHVVAYKGADKAIDAYFGKAGSRGQVVRVAGKDGVFIVSGYQAMSYQKDAKGFRDKTVLKLSDDEVKAAEKVTIDNANGEFVFEKKDGKWTGEFAKLEKDGKPGKPEEKWEKFDPEQVEAMLKAVKALNAVDFGDETTKRPDTGLDDASAQGGLVKVKLKDKEIVLKVGKTQKGKNRWFEKDGDPTVYVVSSWMGDWAVAEQKKFEKKDDKDKKGPPPPPGGDDDGPDIQIPGLE